MAYIPSIGHLPNRIHAFKCSVLGLSIVLLDLLHCHHWSYLPNIHTLFSSVDNGKGMQGGRRVTEEEEEEEADVKPKGQAWIRKVLF